jgi:hypothetical protein
MNSNICLHGLNLELAGATISQKRKIFLVTLKRLDD